MANKKYSVDKKECKYHEWVKNGKKQYICKKCGKTTTKSAEKLYNLMKNIVDLIHGENATFEVNDYIFESKDEREIIHAPLLEVKPHKITWKDFERIKKELKNSENSVFIYALEEEYTTAKLLVYEVLPNV